MSNCKKKLSEKELQKALNEAKATMAVEGLYLTSEEEELILRRHRGEISHEEFLKEVLNMNTSKKKPETRAGEDQAKK